MQWMKFRRAPVWLATCVAVGLTVLGDALRAEDGPAVPTRRLSDSAAWESWMTTRETSFHMVDAGPLNGPPEVPSQLPAIPADARPARPPTQPRALVMRVT